MYVALQAPQNLPWKNRNCSSIAYGDKDIAAKQNKLVSNRDENKTPSASSTLYL